MPALVFIIMVLSNAPGRPLGKYVTFIFALSPFLIGFLGYSGFVQPQDVFAEITISG